MFSRPPMPAFDRMAIEEALRDEVHGNFNAIENRDFELLARRRHQQSQARIAEIHNQIGTPRERELEARIASLERELQYRDQKPNYPEIEQMESLYVLGRRREDAPVWIIRWGDLTLSIRDYDRRERPYWADRIFDSYGGWWSTRHSDLLELYNKFDVESYFSSFPRGR